MLRRTLSTALLIAAAACTSNEPIDQPNDAGAINDAGILADAGSNADATMNADAADPADTGELPDTGVPPDSGVPPDTGVAQDPLEGLPEVTLQDMGYMFTEGPTWRTADGVLLFSDVQANTIYQLTPPATVIPFRMPSNQANGLASDINGLLLACEHETRRVSRTMSDGTVVAIAETYQGDRLNSPNDLIVRSDNTIYFTDPPFGLGMRMREVQFNGVYRIDPNGALTAEWEGAIRTRPNGIALSPDETILYVDESADNVLYAFDVAPTGELSNQRVFTNIGGVGDGMAVDDAGNIFVTTLNGIEVYAPDATQWGTIMVPVQPANVAFGGPDRKTLYITARQRIYSVQMIIPGGN